MDPLTEQLVQRQMGSQVPPTIPNIPTRIPQQMQRFENAQQMQDAYKNGWQPNPILLRAQLGK